MKTWVLYSAIALFVLSGCVMFRGDAVSQAKSMIDSGKAECVIVKDGRIVVTERGRGVSPLLNVHDRHADEMRGGIVVDKVIGRAAAFIAVSGGASHVYGRIMSEDAVVLLKKNSITVSYGTLVPRILNYKRDGLCPLEQSVIGLENAPEALEALRKRIASFKK